MTLFMLQMQPDMTRLMRWAKDQNVLSREADDDLGYSLHALLAANFGTLAPKPFLLQRDPGRSPKLLAYARHDAVELRTQALDFALPEVVAAIGLDTLASKPMPERFHAERHLGFTVRVRPTVRTDRDGDRTRTREIDAFLAAVAGTPQDAGVERATVYCEWLTRRLVEGGCNVPVSLNLSSFRLSPVYRRGKERRLDKLVGPDATFSGTLTVTDPDGFAALLARGIGRHCAFGFGMLLLRPV